LTRAIEQIGIRKLSMIQVKVLRPDRDAVGAGIGR
jgi:hypothetical protein